MPAVTADRFGDAGFDELFTAHRTQDFDTFKRTVTSLVHNNSVSSNGKKMGFIEDLNRCHTKDQVLQKVTNFFLAGEGRKVIKVTKKN